MRKTVIMVAVAIALAISGISLVAMADGGSSVAADDPAGLLRAAYDAATTKRWTALAGVAMIGVTYIVRRFVLGRVAWFQTRTGGFVLAASLSLLGTFGLALATGAEMSAMLALDALGTAMAAAGGWTWLQQAMEKKPNVGGN